ncbi:MAG: dynamin family protein, partial [Chitinophagaceae bacterium]|nr:dynamin family protein [Rubrivivax sp.]
MAQRLDALAAWRAGLDRHVEQLMRTLTEQDLLDETDATVLSALRERLASDKLVLAFVAEFSRGKSELINAIFFADTGRRVLPATPGRTTMCPVELRFDAGQTPSLALLPIETRLHGFSLAELRQHESAWQRVPLDPGNPQSLVQALSAVTRTQRVGVEQAAALGLWNEEETDDNPARGDDGLVEVPAWRHALINYPHPLLERGLVVIDTPGLNAIGAEPELTLGLLPTAHAIVFVLAADTGVTRSDLAIWRQHLAQPSLERFVVLNKIDTLHDPLLDGAEVQAQIEQQRLQSAQTLGMPAARVFALSAREALAARVGISGGVVDAHGLAASRLLPLEQALADQLLPRQQELLVKSAVGVVQQLRVSAGRRLADRRRQQAEQLLELRGLRGKSATKLRLMIERIDIEIAEFERCTGRLAALRSVQTRMLRLLMSSLSSDALRVEVAAMQSAMGARPFNLGARSAFDALMTRLRAALGHADTQADEMRQMLEGSFRQLNSEFGFAFALGRPPTLAAFHEELALIEQNYSRYLTLGQAWRLAAPGFAEQFRRMLVSKLRVVFENAAGELELWSKGAAAQVESQLRERRRGFVRRREALERVQSVSGELEQRIAEVQSQDDLQSA